MSDKSHDQRWQTDNLDAAFGGRPEAINQSLATNTPELHLDPQTDMRSLQAVVSLVKTRLEHRLKSEPLCRAGADQSVCAGAVQLCGAVRHHWPGLV